VTLVGVLGADQSLYGNDYRSYERSFALLTQVVGRGGRAERAGRAVIQTYSPGHPVIELASRQDYPAFYREEAHSRKLHLYPPFCAMMGVAFAGTDQSKALEGARAFLGKLRALAKEKYPALPLRVLGPAPADLFKAAGKYRYRLLLKCRDDPATRALLRETLLWFYGEAGKVSAHIEPYL
jgi:primosomal protein N' (replication factor Y)